MTLLSYIPSSSTGLLFEDPHTCVGDIDRINPGTSANYLLSSKVLAPNPAHLF